jgi:hypothetical protein
MVEDTHGEKNADPRKDGFFRGEHLHGNGGIGHGQRRNEPEGTHKANTGAKGHTRGERMQGIDDRLKPDDQSGIIVSDFVKCLDLCLEYKKNIIERIACIDLQGEWVVAEIVSRLIGILGQGGIEDDFEGGGRGDCVSSRRHRRQWERCWTL